MLLVGLPANRALIVVKSEYEIDAFLRRGHIKVGNRVLIFQHWSINATRILLEEVASHRWICVWGLPLSEWNAATLRRLVTYVGG